MERGELVRKLKQKVLQSKMTDENHEKIKVDPGEDCAKVES